ncbi:diguanylate cyclase [Actinophytocola sp.]|uniref:GGDEF domain-containing protein n=1 Tax=Actinophytocola sp. TaxID=1872138 RepID=UPI002D807C3E|nr:diguanylate cyclase [Actinophytocola sp.]HET9143453.1 diguanylate cyclase [Actinophytocola sp.]
MTGLTGLPDLWGWTERAEKALAATGNRATALLLVELEGLHRITEQHGRRACAAVRRAVTSALLSALRGTDVAGRVGHEGDGFLVLLPARDRHRGELIARRIRTRIRRAIIPVLSATGTGVVITNLAASVGVAVSDPSTSRSLTLPELVQQADIAVLRARSQGGDQVIVAGTGTQGI